MKKQKMRAEKPCRIQCSEFQTEPYSVSYGQKPFWRAPVKILMASWDTRASKWQSEAWRLILYCKNQYKVARPTISPARDERDIDFDCIFTVLGGVRVADRTPTKVPPIPRQAARTPTDKSVWGTTDRYRSIDTPPVHYTTGHGTLNGGSTKGHRRSTGMA